MLVRSLHLFSGCLCFPFECPFAELLFQGLYCEFHTSAWRGCPSALKQEVTQPPEYEPSYTLTTKTAPSAPAFEYQLPKRPLVSGICHPLVGMLVGLHLVIVSITSIQVFIAAMDCVQAAHPVGYALTCLHLSDTGVYNTYLQ